MVKVVDYEMEQDAIEFLFIESTSEPVSRVITRRKMKQLLEKDKKRPFSGTTIEERLVGEVQKNGGMNWVEDEIEKFAEL